MRGLIVKTRESVTTVCLFFFFFLICFAWPGKPIEYVYYTQGLVLKIMKGFVSESSAFPVLDARCPSIRDTAEYRRISCIESLIR